MAVSKTSADLMFLYEKEGVHKDITDKLTAAEVYTMKQFAVLVDTAEELRALAKDSFGVDSKDLAGKVKLSKLVCAWNSAKARAVEQDKTEAEAQVRSLAKPIQGNDYTSMRKYFKDKFWKLDDSKAPSQQYIEQQLERVEKQDWRAEKLSDVVAFKEDTRDGMLPVFDITGVFKNMKTRSTVALPMNSEELRHRFQIMAASWVFVASQQTQNPFLKDLVDDAPTTFGHYADYLLGERVWKLTAKDSHGAEVSGPNWTMLLTYEFEIRAHAANLMAEDGTPFLKALKEAWNDKDVKDLNFLTPLKLSTGTKRAAPDTPGTPGPTGPGLSKKQRRKLVQERQRQAQQQFQPQLQQKGQKGKGKGKDKGKKGKGKGSKGPPPDGCAARTPDNKPVCYSFNRPTGCQNPNCGYEHVCGVCFAPGKPMHSCTH